MKKYLGIIVIFFVSSLLPIRAQSDTVSIEQVLRDVSNCTGGPGDFYIGAPENKYFFVASFTYQELEHGSERFGFEFFTVSNPDECVYSRFESYFDPVGESYVLNTGKSVWVASWYLENMLGKVSETLCVRRIDDYFVPIDGSAELTTSKDILELEIRTSRTGEKIILFDGDIFKQEDHTLAGREKRQLKKLQRKNPSLYASDIFHLKYIPTVKNLETYKGQTRWRRSTL